MNRREFLLFKKEGNGVVRLSCEQLYMRYVDSTTDGTTAQLFEDIEHSLSSVTSLRLTDPSWLSCDELMPLQSILDAFRARGGRIEKD
jgi:hypothetical protein